MSAVATLNRRSMQPTPSPGKLARLLSADSLHYATALQIESIFNIDMAFPAPRNLAEELLNLLPYVHPTNRQAAWLSALQAIQTSGASQSWRPTPKTGTDLNPLNQRFGHYPLAAYLLQDSNNAVKSQTLGVKLLFLYVLLQRPSDNHGLTSHANELRLATRRNSKQPEILQVLPLYLNDFHDYHQKLKGAVKQQLDGAASSPLLDSLRALLEMAPRRAPAPPDINPTQAPVVDIQLPPTNTLTHDDSYTGNIVQVCVDTGDPRTAEPPEFINYFEAAIHPENDDDEESTEAVSPQLLDEFSADFQARTSEYWLRRHHKLPPTDWGRFTPPEKKHLADFINNGLSSSDEQERITAGLIGTMYITGMPLANLLLASTGPDQTFSAIGSYIRDIRKPINGFTPKDAQLAALQPTATRLLLQLPEPIASWIGQLCQRNQPTLEQCLGMDLDAATTLVKNGVEQLRDNGRLFRVRLERIPTALALETTLRFRDPVITYLLAARENQATPKLSYYVSCPTDELIQAYNIITSEMICP